MRPRRLIVYASCAVAAVALSGPQPVDAADHIDAPIASVDAAADIGDLLAWHTGTGTIVAVLTYGSLLPPGDAPIYDGEVLYTLHIDSDLDSVSDTQVHVRAGQNALGDWGVQALGVPGAASADLIGPVETEIDGGNGTRVYAGVFDDPFFFDYDGFSTTLANTVDNADPNDLAFSGLFGTPFDSFEGLNTMAIVVEFDAAAAASGGTELQLWATTGRVDP